MAANQLKLAHEQAGSGAALVCRFRGLNKDRLLQSALLLWRTAALAERRLVLLCGLMFVLETDIIFVYTSLRSLCHYLRLTTTSQLFLDAGSLLVVPQCLLCAATYLAREGIPINFQQGETLNVSNNAYIRLLPC